MSWKCVCATRWHTRVRVDERGDERRAPEPHNIARAKRYENHPDAVHAARYRHVERHDIAPARFASACPIEQRYGQHGVAVRRGVEVRIGRSGRPRTHAQPMAGVLLHAPA